MKEAIQLTVIKVICIIQFGIFSDYCQDLYKNQD